MRKLAVLFLALTLTAGLVACEDTANDANDNSATTVISEPTNIPKPDVEGEPTVTSSGLTIVDIEEGDGQAVVATDTVTVHYTGWLEDGTTFDSSIPRGEPSQFPLDGVIAGWTEGLQGMKAGGKRRLVIPPDLAYGAAGRPGIPPNATLTFDIELVSIP